MNSSCNLNFNSHHYDTVFLRQILLINTALDCQDIQPVIQPTWTFLCERCPTFHCACSNCPASPTDEEGMVSASVICNVTDAHSTDLYVSQGYWTRWVAEDSWSKQHNQCQTNTPANKQSISHIIISIQKKCPLCDHLLHLLVQYVATPATHPTCYYCT